MGRVINGANGAVSGKVGSVVFCKWKGIDYVRGLPNIPRNRKATKKQAKQRSKFSFMQEYLKPIVPLVRLGFIQYAPNRTGHNSAMSYNIMEAVEEAENGYRVVPEKFMFSRGVLPAATTATIKQEGKELVFSWKYNLNDDKEHKNSKNRTLLLLYPADTKIGSPIYSLIGNFRSEEQERVSIGSSQKGDLYHAYLAFFAHDGSNLSSDSIYIGTIEIQ